MNPIKVEPMDCPACGGHEYSWGFLRAQGLQFVPDTASRLRRLFGLGWELRSRRCEGCGNIQLFQGVPAATGLADEIDRPVGR